MIKFVFCVLQCKKKHTLVCPDFTKTGVCPRGVRCKLQHRHPSKRSAGPAPDASGPPKRTRTKETSRRPRVSVASPVRLQTDPQTPPTGHLELPSFISLCSSPEDADAPNIEQSQEVKGKSLQIKPRL
ncbi:zinc finger CCCH domain-containing protein 3-like [Sphaeramia orbicularis]|uniref:zinc finger CCCH domain-containing protein 3-like n=1 Tax=Sphaeramia orbicularis TaxID=375764 RepID=UPI00117E83C1|nr:zinc finger CCCH domain-containing protein 3-like [Sphaeramia orbicularis]